MPWGVAAAGVSAAGQIISSKNANQTSTQSSQSPQLTTATNAALLQGENIANRAFTPYQAPVVAPMSANQQQGSALAAAGSPEAQTDLTQAGTMLSGVKDYSESNLQPYMDPYVSSVLTPQLNEANIQYEQGNASLLNSKAGAFGGDRSALEAGQNTYNYEQTTAADIGNAYSNAFTNAQTAFFNDQQKQISAANALATVGGDVSKLNTQNIQNLMATGGISQALSQAQLDFNYNQFIQNRDWSVTNLQPLLNSIAAAKGANMTSTTTGPQSGVAGEALGAAATIAGAYFTGGQSVTSPDTNQGSAAGNAMEAAPGSFNSGNSAGDMTGYTGPPVSSAVAGALDQ